MSLGYHASKNKIEESLQHLRDNDIDRPIVQIYVTGPRDYRELLNSEDKLRLRQLVNQGNAIVVHGSYADNPWQLKPGTLHNIHTEMRICQEIGAIGLVVHLAAGAANPETIKHIVESLRKLPESVKHEVVLFWEINVARPSIATFETPEKIAKFWKILSAANGKDASRVRFGLCIDTAHLYSCGVVLDSQLRAKTWIRELELAIGKSTPLLLHLNDSNGSLGVDKHANLMQGKIWKIYSETGTLPQQECGLLYLLKWAEKHEVPVILERDDPTHDLMLIKKLGFEFNK